MFFLERQTEQWMTLSSVSENVCFCLFILISKRKRTDSQWGLTNTPKELDTRGISPLLLPILKGRREAWLFGESPVLLVRKKNQETRITSTLSSGLAGQDLLSLAVANWPILGLHILFLIPLLQSFPPLSLP